MKMTNEDMVDNVILLSSLKETGKLGYALARNTRLLRETAKEYIDMRDKLMAEYADPKTGRAMVKRDIYTERLGDYMDIEHEFTPYQISEELFCSGGLTSVQMERLMWMVDKGGSK